jgi:hypothetical protein
VHADELPPAADPDPLDVIDASYLPELAALEAGDTEDDDPEDSEEDDEQ